jgi:predicted nucleic acid binding AN1-type Zn finger protein
MTSSYTVTCQIKGFILRCGSETVGQCVYCGRPFCKRHGVILAEGEEVCSRKNCVSKREDLTRHLAYKDAVLERNRQRLCGVEGCENAFAAQCSRCKGYFCPRHAEAVQDHAYEGMVRVERSALLCKQCQRRRSVWTRQ